MEESCQWFDEEDYCNLNWEYTDCQGDTSVCECVKMRQDELESQKIDFEADAERERNGRRS